MNAKHLLSGSERKKNTRKISRFPSFLVLVRFNEEDDDKKMKHKTAHDDDDKQTPPYHPSIVRSV